METKYGLRGAIIPTERFKVANEAFEYDGFELEIKDGMISVGYHDMSEIDRARKIVHEHLAWFSLTHGVSYTTDLNQSWEVKPDSTKAFTISVSDTLNVTADLRVSKATIEGKTRIVTQTFDSSKVETCSALVKKSQKSPALAAALGFFSQEVIDVDRPLYGVYKALEELCHAVGGRSKLAGLINRSENFVGEVMETTQTTRHARTKARHLLSDQECRERARTLIEAFANTI